MTGSVDVINPVLAHDQTMVVIEIAVVIIFSMAISFIATTPIWLPALAIGYLVSWPHRQPAASGKVCALVTLGLLYAVFFALLIFGGYSVIERDFWLVLVTVVVWSTVPVGGVAYWAGSQRAEIWRRGPLL